MKIAVFNTKLYDRTFLESANRKFGHELVFFEPQLSPATAPLASGFEAICVFVNDKLNREALHLLKANGTRLIALRCAGFNNIDLEAAHQLNFTIVRVPAYSPNGVAEHAVALILALNRKIHRAHNRVREGNFSLEGLLGFELKNQTVGVIGTGKIGSIFATIMAGFGCRVIAYDPVQNESCIARYVDLDALFKASDIISLHLPLTHDTYHVIDGSSVEKMKEGVMLINTSRGGLIDTQAVIQGLKRGKIGFLGLDVYEEEAHLFFEDLSGCVIQDDVFARLITFPNVIVTGHQAFFTRNALENIAEITLGNIKDFENNKLGLQNQVLLEFLKK
jgi:D-lactate dehydrogenase